MDHCGDESCLRSCQAGIASRLSELSKRQAIQPDMKPESHDESLPPPAKTSEDLSGKRSTDWFSPGAVDKDLSYVRPRVKHMSDTSTFGPPYHAVGTSQTCLCFYSALVLTLKSQISLYSEGISPSARRFGSKPCLTLILAPDASTHRIDRLRHSGFPQVHRPVFCSSVEVSFPVQVREVLKAEKDEVKSWNARWFLYGILHIPCLMKNVGMRKHWHLFSVYPYRNQPWDS